jgi:hypothetical protein
MWCLGLNPSVKLHTLHGSLVPAGVTVLLWLCNQPRRGHGEPAKLGLLYPLVWIPYYDTVSEKPWSRSRVKYRCISSYNLIPYLPCYYPLQIIYFMHLLSTNHKCTQPCYFPLPLKPAAQKLKKIWSTSIWCSRRAIAPGRLPVELWCLFDAMLSRVFDLVFCKDIIR